MIIIKKTHLIYILDKIINLLEFDKTKNKILILAYHSISNGRYDIDIPPSLFEEQIKWIRDNFKIIKLRDLININNTSENIAIITFDDGYKDYKENALPILLKYEVPSICFIITKSLIEKDYIYNFKSGYNKKPLSIRDIEEIKKERLVEFGSHSHSHLDFSKLNLKQQLFEISRSYNLIKDMVGSEEIFFCYPWGNFNKNSISSVKKYYSGAVTGRGVNIFPINLYNLLRIPIKNGTMKMFKERIENNLSIDNYMPYIKRILDIK